MISVSVCMIVKNESKVLTRCLDSLQGLYEELIIVDTGSSDNTREIAALYTDKLYDYQWIDDFAAARNFAFEKASMDYIYTVDADEVLDETNRARFIKLKEDLLPEIEIVQMWYVNTKKYATTENYEKEYRPKLYKRLRTFRWIDPIHESVNLNPVVFDSDIEISHMPESNHGKRDFRVFEKAIGSGRLLSGKLHKMYARELMLTGDVEDFKKAEQYFLIKAMDCNSTEEERDYSYVILAHLYRELDNMSEFFKWGLKNICTKPSAEICCEIGKFYFAQGDIQEALVWFQNAMTETEAILDAKSNRQIPASMMKKCYEILAEMDEWMKDIYLEEVKNFANMLADFENNEGV